MYRLLLLVICFAEVLQVCLAQDRCEVISDRDKASKDRVFKVQEKRDNDMAVGRANPIRGIKIKRRHRRAPKFAVPLRAIAAEANAVAKKLVFPKPNPGDICKQERKDIVLSPWMKYKMYICFVPPPFSSYRFFNMYCPCCKPCNISGNPCGFYLCLPEAKRTYTVPGFCWKKDKKGQWKKAGWIKMTFITYQACCCKRILFSASKGR